MIYLHARSFRFCFIFRDATSGAPTSGLLFLGDIDPGLQRLVDKLGPVPLHNKVAPFVFPCHWIIFVSYRAVQYIIASVHADDQRSEVRVIVIVEVDAQPDNGGSENGKGLPPSIPASDIDFDLMGVSGGAIYTVKALLSVSAEFN